MITFFPKTVLGKRAIGFILLFFLLFFIFQLFVASGQRGGEKFFTNLFLAIPILLAGIFGISAFFTGVISMIKQKERSILVFLTTLLGLFILIFVLAEILFPH